MNYRAVTSSQRNAPDALSELSLKDRFKINSFIPMLDALEANFKRRAIVYSSGSQSGRHRPPVGPGASQGGAGC